MKRILVGSVVALLLGGALAPRVWAQDVSAALQQLRSDDGKVRQEALAALLKAGPQAVQPLLGLVGGDDQRAAKEARVALESIAYQATRPGATAERDALAKILIPTATGEGPVPPRLLAVGLLGFVGTDAATGPLGSLLADGDLQDAARRALQRIPGEAATKALMAALATADDGLKAGLLGSLGERHDAAAVDPAAAALESPKPAVRRAALECLARLPVEAAAAPLEKALGRGPEAEQAAARAAYLGLGETLLVAGNKAAAGRVFRRALTAAKAPHERAAGLLGLGKAEGAAAVPTLLRALDDVNMGVRGAARLALAEQPEPHVSGLLTKALSEAAPPVKAQLLAVLARRRDDSALSAIIENAKHEDEQVRLAAITALSAMGGAGGVGALVAALSDPSEKVGRTAETVLSHLPGAGVGEALARAAGPATRDARLALLSVFAERRERTATPVLVAALQGEEAEVRLAALDALREVADPAATQPLLDRLGTLTGNEARAAEAALGQLRGEQPTQTIAAALQGATGAKRAALLRVLGPRKIAALRDTYLTAAKDPDEPTAVAAREALGQLGDQALADTLIALAAEGGDQAKAAAVRAVVWLADQQAKAEPDAARAKYHRALELAQRDDERRQALAGLRAVADISSLPRIRPLLEQAGTRNDAAAAVVPVADKLRAAGDDRQAVELYTAAAKSSNDRDLVRDSIRKLREMGAEVDIVAEGGFVGQWWVVGPFRKRKDIEATDLLDTAKPVDVTKPLKVGDQEFRWRVAPVDDPVGMLDLEQALARADDCGGYAYAELQSDKDQDVLLKIGSDDGVWVWLNGEKIHVYPGDRGYGVDQDVVRAHLKAGVNTLLCKVSQGGGQWALGVRVTDPEGGPLRLKPANSVAELAARQGAVAYWWVLGPLGADEKAFAAATHFPPDQPVDVGQPLKVGDQTLRWRRASVHTVEGMLDLQLAIANRDHCGGYAVAELQSDKDQDVLLKIGSDDSVTCWLNGQKVHDNPAFRPFKADQDSVPAHLKAGKNTILAKVAQGTGQWAVGVRVTDPQGQPVMLKQQ
jgi:HEAT repeat protein